MDLTVEGQDHRFRVWTHALSFSWPATPPNRKVAVVVLRSLTDGRGRPLCTLQQLATLLGSANRQAASHQEEDLRTGGAERPAVLLRQREVDAPVVEAVWAELRQEPLVATKELGRRVQRGRGRWDLSAATSEAALDQVSCAGRRRVLRAQWAPGGGHAQEGALLEALLRTCEAAAGPDAGIAVPWTAEPWLVDPTAIRPLVTPDMPVAAVSVALRWSGVWLTLSYGGVPLSRLGQGGGGPKTRVWRWLLGWVRARWPAVQGWLRERLRGRGVSVDETGLKIRRRWSSWCVVVEAATELPLVTSLSPPRRGWACRWGGVTLRRLGLAVNAVVTEGVAGDAALVPEGGPQLGVVPHQQGVTRWCRDHLEASEQTAPCQQARKRVGQTAENRPVRRRWAQRAERATALGMTAWLSQRIEKGPSLVPAIGRRGVPRTINGIERFVCTVNRFSKGRCGFQSVRRAKGELGLVLLVSLGTQRAKDGHAPIAAIRPEASTMPLYRLLNAPLAVLVGLDQVTLPQNMADDARAVALAA